MAAQGGSNTFIYAALLGNALIAVTKFAAATYRIFGVAIRGG